MGVRLNWIAVERGGEAGLVERLGFEACGSSTDQEGGAFVCAVLPSGWLVLVSHEMRLELDALLRTASTGGLALGGAAEEHVMYSELQAYREGAKIWGVRRDPDGEAPGLAVEGAPPAPFERLRASAAGQAADGEESVDYFFDVPGELGREICGYAYDRFTAPVWTLLTPRDAKRPLQPAGRLPEAIERTSVEALERLGWSRLAQPNMGGFELERVHEHRRQFIAIQWHDHAGLVDTGCRFGVLQTDGDRYSSQLKLRGTVVEPTPSLWRKLADRLAGRTPKVQPGYEEKVVAAAAELQDHVLAVHHYLSGGERDPRIAVKEFEADA